jgi:hypothetical protein
MCAHADFNEGAADDSSFRQSGVIGAGNHAAPALLQTCVNCRRYRFALIDIDDKPITGALFQSVAGAVGQAVFRRAKPFRS